MYEPIWTEETAAPESHWIARRNQRPVRKRPSKRQALKWRESSFLIRAKIGKRIYAKRKRCSEKQTRKESRAS